MIICIKEALHCLKFKLKQTQTREIMETRNKDAGQNRQITFLKCIKIVIRDDQRIQLIDINDYTSVSSSFFEKKRVPPALQAKYQMTHSALQAKNSIIEFLEKNGITLQGLLVNSNGLVVHNQGNPEVMSEKATELTKNEFENKVTKEFVNNFKTLYIDSSKQEETLKTVGSYFVKRLPNHKHVVTFQREHSAIVCVALSNLYPDLFELKADKGKYANDLLMIGNQQLDAKTTDFYKTRINQNK